MNSVTKTKRVVIIDDSETNRNVLQEMVTNMAEVGEAIVFGDPSEASDWLTLNPADLIIIDYRMPEINGIDLTGILRNSIMHTTTPIIMMSAVTDRTIKHQALLQGATHFMTRPIDVIECQSNCRTLLSLSDGYQATPVKDNFMLNSAFEFKSAEAKTTLTPNESHLLKLLAKQVEFREGRDGTGLERISGLTVHIAEASKQFSDAELEMLEFASLLYDVGKIKLKESITEKPGHLDQKELEQMRLHAEFGYILLQEIGMPVTKYAAEVALYHHENYDGSGYPYGLKAENIPKAARLVSLTSSFHALVSERPFREKKSISYAIGHINHFKGSLFDPLFVDVLNDSLSQIDIIYKDY